MNIYRTASSLMALSLAISTTPTLAQNYDNQVQPEAAQSSETAQAEPPGDIVVTAQRRSESINRVPLSIQAFGSQQLRSAGVTDTAGLTQLTPGLTFAKSAVSAPIYTLRGVGFNTPNLSSTSPVGVYADEVAYAYPYMSGGPIFDLERVEVLKGPQGTLYGRNTTGGLINFIAAKPTSSFEARGAVELGNYDTYNFEGFVSAPLTPTLGVRISGRWENSDKGWQKSVSRNDRLGKKDKLGLRAVVDWSPTEALSVELIANYWRDRSDTVAGQAVAVIPNIPGFTMPDINKYVRANWNNDEADWTPAVGAQAPYKAHSDFYSLSARVKYALNDNLSLVSLTAYNDLKRHDVNDVDGTPYELFAYVGDGRIRSFSQEARIVGEYDRINFTAGGYYSRDKIRDNLYGQDGEMSAIRFLRFFAQNVIDPMNTKYSAGAYASRFGDYTLNLSEISRTYSAFLNTTYKVTDQLSVTGGIRYTNDRLTAFGCARDANGTAIPLWNTAVPALVQLATGTLPLDPVTRNSCLGYSRDYTRQFDPNLAPLEEENVAGRLSVQYQPDAASLVYASFSRGFKSGAFPLVPINNASQAEPARQEKVMAYELGAKTGLFDRQLQVNLAGFYYDYSNKQLYSEVPDIVFTALTRLVNIPRSEVYGGELELTWRPRSGFNARVGVGYTESRVLEYNGFTRSALPLNFRGQHFSNTPKWQVNGGVGYSGDVGPSLTLRANLNANYQSKTSSSLSNERGFEVKAYTTVNASISLGRAGTGWEVGLWAKNLLDENYWSSANYFADAIYRLPGQPRTLGVTLAWNVK